MRARLAAVDSHLNWTAIASCIAIWNISARLRGGTYVSDWFRTHPLATVLFLSALANHLAPTTEEHPCQIS